MRRPEITHERRHPCALVHKSWFPQGVVIRINKSYHTGKGQTCSIYYYKCRVNQTLSSYRDFYART